MYKTVKNILSVNGLHIIDSNIYTFINEVKKLCEFDLEGNLLWSTSELDIYYRYCIYNDLIIYYLKNKQQETFFLERNSKKILKHEKSYLNVTQSSFYYNNFLYSFSGNDDVLLYDLRKLQEIKKVKINIIGTTSVYEKIIVSKNKCKIQCLSKEKLTELWQKNLDEIISYNDWDGVHRGEISNVYEYNNQLIVLSGNSVLALHIDTGEILWKLSYKDFTPYTLHIVGNNGYLAKGVFYAVIDLEKGEKILEIEIDNPFDRKDKNQNNYAMVGSDITYYNGKIYFSDKQKNGKYYLFCLNPEIGIIEDYMFLEGIDSNLAPPKFHKNKMFLLDSKSTLHIFQEDIKGKDIS